ncbi:MAG TPA: NAD(P)/FAD-dependent oxidoreductase [Acidimicrobiales bacterium]|nr:NAD(P)/FAD-dependent oxidoreductase [Acidimicrobiales bacterium]
MHDAVVVGGGPAGLSAGLWLARYQRHVVVLDSGEHRNRWVDDAHGYLGSDPMNPAHFLEQAREDLLRYPEAEVCAARATSARREDDGTFTLDLEDGEPLRAKRVVLATGVRDVFPEVENFFEHYGASVFHCPTCDGYESRNQTVVAFGWSEQVVGFTLTLLGWAASVTVVTDGRRFEGDAWHRERLAAQGVRVLEDDAVELLGTRGDLQGVRMRSGAVVPCRLAFFSIAHVPSSDLDLQLGCRRSDEGCTGVDHQGATDVPGVYAAGDMTPGLQLVQVAAAKGTMAGVACAQSLRGEGGLRPGWEGAVPGYEGPMTQHQDAERPAAARLDELGDEIDGIRTRTEGGDEHTFIQQGHLDEGEPVDNTIAPPG